jgi:DNA-binding MarR family transcriptional regulator
VSTDSHTIRRTGRLSELPAEIRGSVGFLLHRSSTFATRSVAEQLAPMGLEVKHFGLLCALHQHGPQPQGWLGDHLGIDRTTMVQLVDELERRGFVERQRNPVDRRSYAVTITEAGVDVWRRARRGVDRWEREFLEALAPEERDQLRSFLARLVEAHEAPADASG